MEVLKLSPKFFDFPHWAVGFYDFILFWDMRKAYDDLAKKHHREGCI